MQKADLLLLPLNEIDSANTHGRIPGKLFEYIAIGKPILMLGNASSDSGQIVKELGNSWCVGNEDDATIYNTLVELLSGTYKARQQHFDASRFERRNLTKQLARCLNALTDQKTPRWSKVPL